LYNGRVLEESLMIDAEFFRRKFTKDKLLEQYLNDLKKLRVHVHTPEEKERLRRYGSAVMTVKNAKVKDIAKFALSFGRHLTGRPAKIKESLPIILGYEVTNPKKIDVEYAKVLLHYAEHFKENKTNLKDWSLHFIVNSKFSPVKKYIDHELDALIQNTAHNIKMNEAEKGTF